MAGFAILISETWYHEAQNATYNETSTITTLIRMAPELDPQNEKKIVKTFLAYVNYVVYEEWPLLIEGEDTETKAEPYLQTIWKTFANTPTKSTKDEILYSLSLNIVDRFFSERSKRMEFAAAALHPILWALLLTLGFLLIFLMIYYSISDFKNKLLFNYIFILLASLLLFFIFMLDYPFRRQIRLYPTEFQNILINHSEIQKK